MEIGGVLVGLGDGQRLVFPEQVGDKRNAGGWVFFGEPVGQHNRRMPGQIGDEQTAAAE